MIQSSTQCRGFSPILSLSHRHPSQLPEVVTNNATSRHHCHPPRRREYSMQLNASRIKVLQAQDKLVNSMKEAAAKELLNVAHHHHTYRHLLRDLIVQGLLRLKEPSVLLRCREEDLELVDAVLHAAKHEYAEKADVHPPEIIVDNYVYLPSSHRHNAHGQFCSGGVVLASRDGKIVCENTLDARLEVVFRKKLPEIRRLLFTQDVA